jgi:hypothetical protein
MECRQHILQHKVNEWHYAASLFLCKAIEGSRTKKMWFHSNKLLQNGQKHDQTLIYSHPMAWINVCCNSVINHLGHTVLPPIHWAIIYIHIHTWNKHGARTGATLFLQQTFTLNRTNICLTAPQHNTLYVSRPTLWSQKMSILHITFW